MIATIGGIIGFIVLLVVVAYYIGYYRGWLHAVKETRTGRRDGLRYSDPDYRPSDPSRPVNVDGKPYSGEPGDRPPDSEFVIFDDDRA